MFTYIITMPRGRQYRRPVKPRWKTKKRQSKSTRQRNANSQAINRLVRQVYVPRQFQLTQAGTLDQSTHLYPIVFPSEYSACFQNYNSVAGTGVGSQYHMSGIKTRWMIQPESVLEGTADVWLQVFIVSLMPGQARKFRNDGNALVDEHHFVYGPLDTIGGLSYGNTHVMLNREIFKVHYSSGTRRIGNVTLIGEEVTNIQDTATYGHTYTPWKKTIKGETSAQQFTAMSNEDIRDSAQLYVLIFSNATDASELFYSFNHVIYGSSTRGV